MKWFFSIIFLGAVYRVNCCHAQTLSWCYWECQWTLRTVKWDEKKCRWFPREQKKKYFPVSATIYNLSSGKNLTNLMKLHRYAKYVRVELKEKNRAKLIGKNWKNIFTWTYEMPWNNWCKILLEKIKNYQEAVDDH